MTNRPKIALAGATGSLGAVVLAEVISSRLSTRLLVRKGGSTPTINSEEQPLLDIAEVDYADSDSLTKALQGIDVVICTFGNVGLESQIPLIDAAVAAGVKRFIPSDFGGDIEQEKNAQLPLYHPKIRILDYLKREVAQNPGFVYTRVTNHSFLDWGLRQGLLIDPKADSITVYNGGNTPVSFTTLSTIAKAVVGIVANLEATKNRAVFVHDAALTQRQLIHYAQEVLSSQWIIEDGSTKQLLKESFDELEKPSPDIQKAMVGFIFVALYDEDHEPDLTDRLDNELLGIPVMTDAEVSEAIKTALTVG
ncbi:oxidoreductase CipA-like protein [Podospora didyma]|uniref:Oxidoreductase CipA-like protein n=1 Tax=Podospora didyma TaxID=330526 RepID=A0AAE0NQT1_9PEZI|nr:oxidoreductase CipA-like protein [Podospora didyma]